ncbi:MAG TPA: menaquinone biosynthesis protein [Bacteroidales bacterium]|nr:menaquinone biosynthesis protein [Bacteroidales bacterium]
MDKIRISAVKYANTYPFIYGLKKSGFGEKIILETDHPVDCAEKLINNRADIGLIPVAALLQMKEYHIISDYCLSSNGNVRTVMLLRNCSFEELDTIYLDYRSKTSVTLAKILAKHWWKRTFKWVNTSEGFDFLNIGCNEAVVLIGDQCFEYEKRFRSGIDLSMEWKKFTGLPFVFACWAANKTLDPAFLAEFNSALKTGVDNIDEVVKSIGEKGSITGSVLKQYLTENIDFNLNEEKKKGLEMFLTFVNKLDN